MWIERISLENFLVFRDFSVELAPGLNVVLSPNESGKSSLFRGVAAGFYANAASQKGDILALTRWGSVARPRIEIEFRLGQDSYRLVRDFDSKEQTIFRSGEARPFEKGKAVDEFLGAHLPVPDENLFLRVCGVRHEELALVCDGASAIGETIEEILGGGWGNATPAGVQKIVEDKRKELIRGRDRPVNEANRGPVKRFMDDVERLERDAARASAVASARTGFLKTISDIDSKTRLLDADIDLLRAKREKASAYRDLEKNEKAVREKADGLRKRKERIGELSAKRQALAAEGSRFPESILRGAPAFLDELRADLERESLLLREIGGAGARGGSSASLWRPVLASALILAGVIGVAIGKPLMTVFLRRRRRPRRLAFREQVGPRGGRGPGGRRRRARAPRGKTGGVARRSLSRGFENAPRGVRRVEGSRARRRIENRGGRRRPAGRSDGFRRSARPGIRRRRPRPARPRGIPRGARTVRNRRRRDAEARSRDRRARGGAKAPRGGPRSRRTRPRRHRTPGRDRYRRTSRLREGGPGARVEKGARFGRRFSKRSMGRGGR